MQKASDNSVLSYVEAAKNSLESAEVFYGHGTDNALDELICKIRVGAREAKLAEAEALMRAQRGFRPSGFSPYKKPKN